MTQWCCIACCAGRGASYGLGVRLISPQVLLGGNPDLLGGDPDLLGGNPNVAR